MLPESLVSRYRFRRELGRGGFGMVVEAEDLVTGREVAIKTLLEVEGAARERFEREARTLASIRHPGVVEVLDFGVVGGVPYVVMERVAGGPLAAAPWPAEEVARCVAAVGGALDAVHEAGVVHRDLKPENILRRDDGGYVLVDFGLARSTEAGATLTQDGMLFGTPAFMAPELWRGEPASPASDQFALAATACVLLTGSSPVPGREVGEICRAALAGKVAVPPGVPEALREPLARALRADPAARYARCANLAEALEGRDERATSSARTVQLERPPEAAPGPAPARRGMAVLAAVGLGFLGLASLRGTEPVPTVSATAPPAPSAESEPPGASPAELRAAAARVDAACQAVQTWILAERPGGELAGLTEGLQERLAHEEGILDTWGGCLAAQADYLRVAPPSVRQAREPDPVFRMLELGLDTERLLQQGFRAGMILEPEEQRAVAPRARALREAAEEALSPLVERPQPPTRRLVLISWLLLAGHADPLRLEELADAALAELAGPPADRIEAAVVQRLAYAATKFSGEEDLPCDLRARWVVRTLAMATDPRRIGVTAPRSLAMLFARLIETCLRFGKSECRDEGPTLTPALEQAIERVAAHRAQATEAARAPLASEDHELEQHTSHVPLPPALTGPFARLREVIGAAPPPANQPPGWTRFLAPKTTKPPEP